MAELKPANENPWYVLATLYGEQTGDGIDWELHEKNRRAWNAWAGKDLADTGKLFEATNVCSVSQAELTAWRTLADEVKCLHQEQMVKRNDQSFVYEGLPSPRKSFDFSDLIFGLPVICNDFAFPTDVTFQNANFKADGQFKLVSFFAQSSFQGAKFNSNAFFREADFAFGIDFREVEIARITNFYSASFGAPNYFGGAQFKGLANFVSAFFQDIVYFRDAHFYEVANFQLARFGGLTNFVNTKFDDTGDSRIDRTSFRDCQFDKPTSFREAVFLKNYPDLSGAVLHDNTTFTAKEGYWPDKAQRPYKDRDEEQIWAEASKDSCATIRHAIAKQGLPEDEHFFFRREMQFAGQIGSWLQRLPYRAFGLVSDYGHSIERPAKSLVTTVVMPSGVFAAKLGTAGHGAGLLDFFREIWAGLGLSFANTFKFFGLQRLHFGKFFQEAGPWLHFLAGTQTVLGFVFLFFLGLGLRQRFRLR
ncbi:pentapeptide repeat-containing protein [Shimia sp. SDUM112013]|uniref:pentapeptide repeat-containing protein n=1 Tax=Shimia sp. SDUM112013 TaxID=3136160 RepID=UPI0032EA91CF